MALTQKNRQFQVATPLGDDVLLFYRMHGSEHLGSLFEYELELLSENPAIDPGKLLGQNVTVSMDMPDGSQRFFNGYVVHFSQHGNVDGYPYYSASVRPWLWFLTRAANCRIFQQKKVPDIIKQVFSDQGFTDIKDKLSGSYAAREYCVQYRETDFDFVSRLMEEEGIYYYFTHENGVHHLVLADSSSSHDKFPGYEKIPYNQEEGTTDRTRTDHIHDWGFSQEIQPGVYSLTDYDFKKPKTNLLVKSALKKQNPHSGYEHFDYPGRYTEIGVGENLARSRIEEEHAHFERCNGNGNARGLGVGYLFKLTDHPREDQNREYLVLASSYYLQQDSYVASGGSSGEEKPFDCLFTVSDRTQAFRPLRSTPKPLVHGAQTAVVSGPAGEEIYTDQYGRVKVQFHWDRYGQRDENSSCWVRVAQPWAGKNWGMITLPRIGQEVVVDFLEGDPDQPLITGSVYNNSQMPPYKLPDKMTLSTWKSYSTKGGDGFNEIRFDDNKGKEQIFIHAEYNQDTRVKNDAYEWIGNDRHLIVVKDQLEEVDGDRHSTVKGDDNEEVKGTVSLKAGMDLQQKVGMKHAVDAGQEIHLKAGMNIVIEAGMSITLKAGGGFIVIGPAGVTISGTPVLINSGGSAGSGSGCSPTAPTAPKEAADDKAGGMDAPPPSTAPTLATSGPSSTKVAPGTPSPSSPASPSPDSGSSSPASPPSESDSPSANTLDDATSAADGPAATALQQAAQDGTPFCEKCAAAAAAANDT